MAIQRAAGGVIAVSYTSVNGLVRANRKRNLLGATAVHVKDVTHVGA